MLEATIRATSVSYRVKGAELVSSIDLTVKPGELVAVIGPNGAGKSTLLSLLSGSLRPSRGDIQINGIDSSLALPGELARELAILTQREPFEVPYTAAQVVEMGRFPHRRAEANSPEQDTAAIHAAMTQTDTAQFADRLFATLSKGEQARVSLARVIAQATPIILLDEPTTALDVAHQERIMGRAVELANEGRTVVAVLHDLNAAAVYAGRVILMSDGLVIADGTPREVLTADLLSTVYGQALTVVDHPLRDCPLVLVAE